jgi:hypothetical protein
VATTTATTTATTVPVPPANTELRFTFEGVTGVQDKILVGTVFTKAQSIAGTVCVPVTSDPFSGTGVVATAALDNPCSHDAPYGVLLTTDGDYSYFIAAFTPGTQTASVCAGGEVTVAGPTEVVITAADLTAENCAEAAG